jgi:hypothetical protein
VMPVGNRLLLSIASAVTLCSGAACLDVTSVRSACNSSVNEASPPSPVDAKPLAIHSNRTLTNDECWVVQDLEIDNGVLIQTNGHKLSIVAFGNFTIKGQAVIQSFDVTQLASMLVKPPKPSKTHRGHAWNPRSTGAAQKQGEPGGTGDTGTQGTPGVDGQDASDIRIYVSGNAKGKLAILNFGSNGGPGGDGGDAGDGGTGEQGGKSTSVENHIGWPCNCTFYTCGSGPGYGGRGGNGGPGGIAGPGGRGGNGGTVNLWILGDSQAFQITDLSASAGKPGEPGIPGKGGVKGCQGFGGLGGPACFGMETVRGCDGCAGSNGADGAVQLLRLGKDGNNNMKWFPFLQASDQSVAEDECKDFGNTPSVEPSANEQIHDLWDLLSPTFNQLTSRKVTVTGGGEAYTVELKHQSTKWEDMLEKTTYTFTQTPPVAPADCTSFPPRPSIDCMRSFAINDQNQLSNATDRLRFLVSSLNLYAEEMSRKSVLVNAIEAQLGAPLPLEASGVYFKWPHVFTDSGLKITYTKMDDELLSRLARTTQLLLDKIRVAIGSPNTGKIAFICSQAGFEAAGFTIDQLSPSFPSLEVSTGGPTHLYGSTGDFGYSMQLKSSNNHSYMDLKDGVVPPVSTGSKAFCNYTERIRKLQFDSYSCLGPDATKRFVTVLRNPLYHPSSSVFFFNLLYLESFFKSENLAGFDIDAVKLVTQPDCIDFP